MMNMDTKIIDRPSLPVHGEWSDRELDRLRRDLVAGYDLRQRRVEIRRAARRRIRTRGWR